MPRYEYRCPKCGHRFEMRQSFHDDPVADCPRCGTPSSRVFHPATIIFKGSGWYVTDYARKNVVGGNGQREESKEESGAKAGEESSS